MQNYESILFERRDRIAIITFNRPEAMNAVNQTLWRETAHALQSFAQDPELWVAIVTGAGDRAFCAGADLKEFAAGRNIVPPEEEHFGFAGIARHHVPKPIIAAVNGFALGGGTEIALACDLVVASEQAAFGLPEVKRGMMAGAGGLLRLPRQLPLKKAMELIMTGETMSAREALEWGLINRVAPHGQVLAAAVELAEKICENAPLSVRYSKEIVYRALDTSIMFPSGAWDVNETYKSILSASEDAKEGPRAFAEKRKPDWKGR